MLTHTTGIAAFTSSDETIQKCFKKGEDSSQELTKHRVKHDNEDLRKVTGQWSYRASTESFWRRL